MQTGIIEFDIARESKITETFRVKKVRSDFDLSANKSQERFVGRIELPDEWNIGVIVGSSGTGKTTIARELFGDDIIDAFDYTHDSVIDDMPDGCTVEEITRMFYAVGFGSVPSWLKPYSVLSNGEKMRVDLARAMLASDEVCFDEFTSVVDRNVAETMCIATNRSVKRLDKKFVAVSCHRDVLQWLQPDWYFDTDLMQCFFASSHANRSASKSDDVAEARGESLGSIII